MLKSVELENKSSKPMDSRVNSTRASCLWCLCSEVHDPKADAKVWSLESGDDSSRNTQNTIRRTCNKRRQFWARSCNSKTVPCEVIIYQTQDQTTFRNGQLHKRKTGSRHLLSFHRLFIHSVGWLVDELRIDQFVCWLIVVGYLLKSLVGLLDCSLVGWFIG